MAIALKLLKDPAEGALQIVCALIAAGKLDANSEKIISLQRGLTEALSARVNHTGIVITDESVKSFWIG